MFFSMSLALMAMTISALSRSLGQHADLAVRLEAGQHPAGVEVVKELAAELQVQLAAELVDALLDVLGLEL